MRRELVVAFALIASLLVVAATPVSAAHGPVVVSSHTTDTDFNSATLTNLTVVGSGSDATVQLSSVPDEDDGGVSYYNFNDGTATDQWGTNNGTVSGATHVASGGPTGDGSFSFDGTDDEIEVPADASLETSTWTVSAWVRPGWTSGSPAYNPSHLGIREGTNVRYSIHTHSDYSAIDVYDGSAFTSTSSTLSQDTWYHVLITADGAAYGVYLDGELKDSGGDGTVSGSYDLHIGNSGKTEWWDGQIDEVRLYNTVLNSTQIAELYNGTKAGGAGPGLPAEYLHNHSAENTVEGYANISAVNNVTITATWRGDSNGDGTYDTLLNQTTGITSAANHTFTWSEFSGDDVQVNLTVESAGSSEAFTLGSEGVLASTSEPSFDNGSASPTGELTSQETTLSINVSDPDFTANGDTVTVEFFTNTSGSVGTDTLTSNGTASITASSLTGGAHTWTAYADDGEHNISSAPFDITVPDELVFRNESNASERVPVAVSVTFIGSDTIVEKTGSENISLSNLPVGSEMVVVVQAAGWTDRTVILSDIFTQSDVYLLNQSLTTTTTVFTVEDRTGQYPTGEAKLVVERIINQSGTPDWRTVQAEKITGAGIVVEMERGERYRFKIRDDDGTVTDLGHITASAEFDGATVNLIVSTTSGTLDEFGGLYAWNTSYEVRESAADRIRFDFEMVDPSLAADDFRLIVSYQSNGTEVSNVSYGDGVTDLTAYVTLPSDSETYRVDWSATIGGEAYSGTRLVGAGRGTLGEGFCGTALESVWCERIALGGLLVVAGLFSAFNVAVGGVVLSSLAGFAWYFGALPSSIGAGAILLGFGLSGLYAMVKGGFR